MLDCAEAETTPGEEEGPTLRRAEGGAECRSCGLTPSFAARWTKRRAADKRPRWVRFEVREACGAQWEPPARPRHIAASTCGVWGARGEPLPEGGTAADGMGGGDRTRSLRFWRPALYLLSFTDGVIGGVLVRQDDPEFPVVQGATLCSTVPSRANKAGDTKPPRGHVVSGSGDTPRGVPSPEPRRGTSRPWETSPGRAVRACQPASRPRCCSPPCFRLRGHW